MAGQGDKKNCCHRFYFNKGLLYGPADLDNRMFDNVQSFQQSNKLHLESHEKLESGISTRKKKAKRGKNPKRHLQKRLTLATTICNSNDDTQLYT